MQIRVIETLDVTRFAFEVQFAAHSLHQSVCVPFGILYFEVFELFGTIYSRTFEREVQQVEFFAAFGYCECYSIEQQRGGWQERHDHFARKFSRDIFDYVLYSEREHFGIGTLCSGGQSHGVNACYRATTYADEVAVGGIVILVFE